MLTQEMLKDVLNYDFESGIFIWIKSTDKLKSTPIYKIAGSKCKRGYVYINLYGNKYSAHRLAWFYIYGEFPENQIDHLNRNKSDNRISNLREATNAENSRNKNKMSNNTSGYVGVSYYKNYNKWIASCQIDKVQYKLGYYDTPEEASLAYQNFIKEKYNEFYNSSTVAD